MRPWLVGVLVAIGAFLVVVIGATAFKTTLSSRDPTPPCPSGWSPTHDDLACVHENEACNTHMSGAYDNILSCPAVSADGSGWLRVNVAGNGGVALSVRDGGGNVVFSRNVAFTEGLLPEISVKGRSGQWKLTTEYHAQGSAMIVLWG